MWASQVWSSGPRQSCPEGTEHIAALITQSSCCHIVTVKHPVPRCHAVLSPPYRDSNDNSDNGSARWTDATQVPSEIWEAESILLSLWFSLCLFLFALCCSPFFPCQREFMTKGSSSIKKTEYVTVERELIGCQQFPAWYCDHSLHAAGTWDRANSMWFFQASKKQFSSK